MTWVLEFLVLVREISLTPFLYVHKKPVNSYIIKLPHITKRRIHLAHMNYIADLLNIKDKHVQLQDDIMEEMHKGVRCKVLLGQLSYSLPACPHCGVANHSTQDMTKVLTEEVNAFKVRTLNDKYVAIFMDATYIPLKRQTVSKEAIYIAIGIREDGTKEVLSYAIAPTDSTYVWNELLQDIYSRGVHDVLLFITDGLKGMKDTIHQIYPKAKYQHCCVHVSRNIAHKVRVKDRKEICDDFKAVYQASSKEEA